MLTTKYGINPTPGEMAREFINTSSMFQSFQIERVGKKSEFLIPAGYSTTARDRELDLLIEQLDGLDGTIVVLGDFNMTDQSSRYRRLTQRLSDAYREAGWGFGHTFPDVEKVGPIPIPFPLVRIDYVFHSWNLTAEKATVGANGGPDHRYLVAELSFPLERQ